MLNIRDNGALHCTFPVILIVIPTMFPLCNFLAKDAIAIVVNPMCVSPLLKSLTFLHYDSLAFFLLY